MSNELPDHPFKSFQQIFKNLAEQYIASPFKRKLFLKLCDHWYRYAGVATAEARIESSFKNREDGYIAKYNRILYLNYPALVASFITQNLKEEPLAVKVARLIVASLRFREKALTNTLEQEFEAKRPMDMSRYSLLFSRITLGLIKNGKANNQIVDMPASDHIILSLDGIHYQLPVLHEGRILDFSVITENLKSIIEDAKAHAKLLRSDRFPLGLYTTLQTRRSIKLFLQLEAANPASIQAINTALFSFAIDTESSPHTLEEIGQTIHTRHYPNRDYRRSMQIVMTANGHFGVLVDPLAGIGGTLSVHFLDEILKESMRLDEAAAPSLAIKNWSRLSFDTAALKSHAIPLSFIKEQIEKPFYPEGIESVFRLDGIGKADFIQLGASPDAAFQAALFLAYVRTFGKTPWIGSFINMRCLQYGNIARYSVNTSEMDTFIAHPDSVHLKAALNAHKEKVKTLKQGTDDMYQLSAMIESLFHCYEISLFKLFLLFILLGRFIPGFNQRYYNPDMWISNITTFPELSLIGRPGVRHPYPTKLAGHYTMFDDHFVICFLSRIGYKSYLGKEKQFAATLLDALYEIKQLLSSS